MKPISLLALRITIGWLMVVWGIDKLTDIGHAQAVAESFYAGIGTSDAFLTAAGGAQILLGLLVVIGLFRRVTLPLTALLTGVTLVAVWRSIIDPWGFVIDGGNLVFYSSAIISAAVLVAWAHIDDDVHALDARRAASA